MIITIARQCGCGAVHVGELLAQHYGIPFYTRQDLMDMAEEKGILKDLDDFFDERPVDNLMFAISSDYEATNNRVNEKPLRLLADMIGDKDCIIIGRCGNHIFRHRNDLVSVFLKGNLETRIQNIQHEENLSHVAAEEFVSNADDCRVVYHKYYTGLTWGNASDYDLCIDSCRLDASQTAELIQSYIAHLSK